MQVYIDLYIFYLFINFFQSVERRLAVSLNLRPKINNN